MKAFKPQDIAHFNAQTLKSLAVEQSQLLVVATQMIKKLEKQVESLSLQLGEKNQKLLFSAEQLEKMRHLNFGRSSERWLADDNPLFGEAEGKAKDESEATPAPKPKKKNHPGRTQQKGLEIQDINHWIAKEDCDQFGLKPWEGQFETSELITVIPSRIIIQRHNRQKYFHWNPEKGSHDIITAPGPLKLKEGSRYSIELAVEMGLAKYQWHLPMDRQRVMLEEHGLEISTQSIWDQIDTVASYLRPKVFKGIVQKIEESRVNIADDTHWPNLEAIDKRERDKFYLWAVTNREATCFNIFEARSQKVAKSFLGGLKGVLVTDGHASFKKLGKDDLTLANDWYHFRRKVKASEKSYPEESAVILHAIRDLSEIEKAIQGLSLEDIHKKRQEVSRPLVERLRIYLDSLSHVLPQSNLGRAVAYANGLWAGLNVFLDNPDVPMHSNDVERAIRGPAVGRKNHYGSKNMESARTAAVWYSIVATCKQNGIVPRDYFVYALTAILSKKPVLMPWEWQNPKDLEADA
jgi:transposase